MKKRFVWTVEIEVDEVWVADGYEATAERVKDALMGHSLGWAADHEVRVRLLKAPHKRLVKIAQGYLPEPKPKKKAGAK